MPGQNDLWPWLQSIMQNQGAAQPSNPAAYPAAAPQAMPGSGLNGMPAMTLGGPSMGYPALGQPGAQPQPPRAPQPSPLGSSVTMAPNQPVGPAGADGGFNNPLQAAANAPSVGIGSYPDSTNYPHNMTPPTFNYPPSSTPTGMPAPPPAGSPSATPRPAKGPLAASGGGGATMKRTPGAPNLGYYQQNPRFGTVQYQTPNSAGSRRRSTPRSTSGACSAAASPPRRPQLQPLPRAPKTAARSPPAIPARTGTSTRKGTWSRRLTARRRLAARSPWLPAWRERAFSSRTITGEPMSYTIADFSAQVALNAQIHHAYPNVAAELGTIATALSSDTGTHDTTITTPPAALQPGLLSNSHFTNDVLLVVNAGKGGNLTAAAMSAAINAGIASEVPPVNSAAPVASGTGTVGQNLTTTNGTWQNAPTSYAYQWMRGGAPILGAVNAVYALVGADSGNSVSCRVTATNPAGSTSIQSNAIAVA